MEILWHRATEQGQDISDDIMSFYCTLIVLPPDVWETYKRQSTFSPLALSVTNGLLLFADDHMDRYTKELGRFPILFLRCTDKTRRDFEPFRMALYNTFTT